MLQLQNLNCILYSVNNTWSYIQGWNITVSGILFIQVVSRVRHILAVVKNISQYQ